MPPAPLVIGQRLKDYMQLRGLSLTSVTRMSPFSAQELNQVIEGETYPAARLALLLDLFDDLNPRWLLEGTEPMLLTGRAHPQRAFRDELEAHESPLRPKSRATTHGAPALAPVPEASSEYGSLREQLALLTARVDELQQQVAALRAQPGGNP